MCQRLGELTSAMTAYAAGFDAERLSCADAAAVVKQAAAVAHIAATIKALAAARAAQAKTWKTAGYRSAEEQLAHNTGTTISEARDALTLGQRLAAQPDVAAAARAGQLSPGQAAAIADAVAADAHAAHQLLDAASAGGSIAELKNRCADIKAAATDLETQRQAVHRRRRLRAWTDLQGEWHLHAAGNTEDGAQVIAALTPLANEIFHHARRSAQHEHPDAYRFDALIQLAVNATTPNTPPPDTADSNTTGTTGTTGSTASNTNGSDADIGSTHTAQTTGAPPTTGDHTGDNRPGTANAGTANAGTAKAGTANADAGKRRQPARQRHQRGAPVKLLIRVDLTTLMRGFPTTGETCELVGYGPISLSAIHKLLQDGNPFVAAILTKAKQVAGVAHLGRQPNAHQRSCLQWLYPTCAAQGCPATAHHLQIDHRHDWAHTHITLIDWLDSLCQHHHNQKTRNGWSLIDGIGKRPFVAPTDPRHPKHNPTTDGPP